MKFTRLPALLLVLLSSASALAQTGNPPSSQNELLEQLRQNLTPEQQEAIMQNLMGGAQGATGAYTRTNPPLAMPTTVTRPGQATETLKERKTADGRVLRQPNEDPELKADDSVLIELTPLDELCTGANQYYVEGQGTGSAANTGGTGEQANQATSTQAGTASTGTGTTGGIDLSAVLGGSAALNQSVLNNLRTAGTQAAPPPVYRRCPTGKPKTDEELDQLDKFRKRILANNPYKLNRFGVLEIPGLPSIPLAGLTQREATSRLNADPDLADFDAKLTLLRLQPFGEEALKPFGYDLFDGSPSTFAPVSDIAVPLDYVIGPGDRLDIQLYGNEPASYKLTVQRDGTILFPKLGPVAVGDMTFDHVRDVIERRVAQQLIGTRVSISMGELRSIRIFVLGEAEKPGSYTVSGLSTMTNALFVSGGVKKIGSLRNVLLKREGRIVSVLDLYDLLLHGDTSGDRKLLPGDVIFIPPIGHTVGVAGSVRRPAIYELKRERTAAEAVELAGGLLPDADPQRVQVERIDPARVREVVNLDLSNPVSAGTVLLDGDRIAIAQIRPVLENGVTLNGWVYRPGKFAWHEGMRLTDIVGSYEELRPDADQHYIMIRRIVPPQEKVEVLSADLSLALAKPGSAADPELKPRDEVTVFDLSASRERIIEPVLRTLELQATPDQPEAIVSVDGRVKAPGRYPLQPDMHVSDLIRAGGSLEDSAYRGSADLTRYEVVDGLTRKTEEVKVDLAAVRNGVPGADISLRPYDQLVIKPIAEWKEPGMIEVMGEVRFPGKYPIHQSETLHSILERAGGLDSVAFAYGAVFIREDLKKREKDQIEMLSRRLQSDLASLSLEAVASSAVGAGGGGGTNAAAGLAIGSQLLQQLRSAKPVGRLVIDIDQIMRQPAGSVGDIVVKDGDKLVVPKRAQEVTILGEVESPTSHVFEAGLSRDDYIAKSGGVTQKADRKRIYIVRANGDVVTGHRGGWFRRSGAVEMRPGDTIVVPLNTERVSPLALWQSVTTIIYNLAIAALLVHDYLP